MDQTIQGTETQLAILELLQRYPERVNDFDTAGFGI
jgi:hypothetical protein